MNPEYIEYLEQEIKHFNKELRDIISLPDVDKFRQRIKKDRRDTQEMLNLYLRINDTNDAIRLVKENIIDCLKEANKQLKRGVKNSEKQVMCIVCKEKKPESEMDNVNICEHCRSMGSERY